ncbi:MAG: hypothetical protein AB8U25_00305 [Rickettsiales endosymbiont of Dermacentor nuttalli]
MIHDQNNQVFINTMNNSNLYIIDRLLEFSVNKNTQNLMIKKSLDYYESNIRPTTTLEFLLSKISP